MIQVGDVCGVSNIEGAPEENLLALLEQIGRNGETSRSAELRKRIEDELEARKRIGVSIPACGLFHHPV